MGNQHWREDKFNYLFFSINGKRVQVTIRVYHIFSQMVLNPICTGAEGADSQVVHTGGGTIADIIQI